MVPGGIKEAEGQSDQVLSAKMHPNMAFGKETRLLLIAGNEKPSRLA